jgi:hypothetical protein
VVLTVNATKRSTLKKGIATIKERKMTSVNANKYHGG